VIGWKDKPCICKRLKKTSFGRREKPSGFRAEIPEVFRHIGGQQAQLELKSLDRRGPAMRQAC
jgi:hypothetical protein